MRYKNNSAVSKHVIVQLFSLFDVHDFATKNPVLLRGRSPIGILHGNPLTLGKKLGEDWMVWPGDLYSL